MSYNNFWKIMIYVFKVHLSLLYFYTISLIIKHSMCELLALSFNTPVNFTLSIKVFRRRGKENPDGWGIAFYPDKAALVIKEPVKSVKSRLLDFLSRYERIRSKIFIAHVRRASRGKVAYKNTHPFLRELNGKEYVFAHNGTLNDIKRFKLGRFKPVGETDSEYAFCYLLAEIEKRGIDEWSLKDFEWLYGKLRELNKLGTLNCLLSDGEYLFAYHDVGGYNGLHYVWRVAPFPKIRLVDEDFEVDLQELKEPNERGYVVASKPLTNEEWHSFTPGELIVFKDGMIVYRSSMPKLSSEELEVLRFIRRSPHRVSLKEIADSCSMPIGDVRKVVRELLSKGLIRQDSRDIVNWNHEKATFYTNPNMRNKIDQTIQ